MEANKKFKSVEAAMDAAVKFFKEKFEYKGSIGIEKKKQDFISFFAQNDPNIEETFSAALQQ